MDRKVGLVLFGVFILVTIGLGLTYQFGGLGNYIQATRAISKLEGDERTKAEQFFYSSGGEDEYRGMLGYVNTGGYGNVLAWGENGPKYFRGDEYTVYSFFNGCSEEILNAKPEDGPKEVKREIYTDVKEWKKRVKNGSFVTIILTNEENGGTVGNLREIWAFDWWYFMPGTMEVQCEK
ncbi:MAG: hypothetical protein Q8L41_00760 [Anaerolineales bacterium]|nr:hypothetical protein [Anaerolineales bacterium]